MALGGEVDDDIVAGDQLVDECGVADVALDETVPGIPSSSSTVARTPAYVSRSRLVIVASSSWSRTQRTKFEPMNPAPPVTR